MGERISVKWTSPLASVASHSNQPINSEGIIIGVEYNHFIILFPWGCTKVFLIEMLDNPEYAKVGLHLNLI